MNILSIGGSDPSSGAGIQSDIKTFSLLDVYGLTIMTSVTSQNTKKFSSVEAVSPRLVQSQLDSVFSDFKIDAIKIGVVYNSPTIKIIQKKLCKVQCPIIVDPVLKSTTGGVLLRKFDFSAYRKWIIPLAQIITPNRQEAELLSGIKVKRKEDLVKCAQKIRELGAQNIVITGVNLEKGKVSDFIFNDSGLKIISSQKISKVTHGSGCNYSASLAVAMAQGKSLNDACEFAKTFTYNSIKYSKKIGKGISITQNSMNDQNKKTLVDAINELKILPNVYKMIPECQTNFVYAKPRSKTVNEILGVTGRIVKAGKELIVAGTLEYGGSKHVATAVLEMTKKFPQIRSGINVKYDPKIISKAKKIGYKVTSYDRVIEPAKIKNKENSSIAWGLRMAIRNGSGPSDIVFHKGDFGKEPMIIIFGKTPEDVVTKVERVIL